MNTINIAYVDTPFGEILLGAYEGKLCLADWRDRKGRETIEKRVQKALQATYIEKEDFVLKQTKEELEAYLKGERKIFDVPLLLLGTAFQKNVWEALMHIPYGTTLSYKELAQIMGNQKAVRAVASSVGANAISILVPCHRIIGSDRSLSVYAGGMKAKQILLEIENNLFSV